MIIVQNPYNTMNVNWLNINTLFEANKYYLSAREHKMWELLEVHDEILKKDILSYSLMKRQMCILVNLMKKNEMRVPANYIKPWFSRLSVTVIQRASMSSFFDTSLIQATLP